MTEGLAVFVTLIVTDQYVADKSLTYNTLLLLYACMKATRYCVIFVKYKKKHSELSENSCTSE